MKPKLIAILIIFIIAIKTPVYLQGYFNCGSYIQSTDKQLFSKIVKQTKDFNPKVSINDSLVPVKIHIIAYLDSSGGVDSNTVLNELSLTNQFFIEAGMIFHHCSNIDFIQSDEYADFEQLIDEGVCNSRDLPNVINIYYVPYLFVINNGVEKQLCGYTYQFGDLHRIIINNSCSNNGTTLAHELGHYFSLLHTHEIIYGQEFVDRINCDTTGDQLCDTPADPELSETNVTMNCQYIGNEMDPMGEYYSPDPGNIMSYSRKYCRVHFTSEQSLRMRSYFIGYRNHLNCIYNGNLTNSSDELGFILFPNPGNNQVAIITTEEKEVNYELSLMDYTGKLIYTKTASNYSYLNVSDLKSGIYFVALSNEKETEIKKLIKSP